MNKAFIDTTILTDVLIKSAEAKKTAVDALKKFTITELPVFAIKEFKAGPLKNFVWMHNKLVIVGSYAKALEALQRMSRTPRRYTTSTALEALREAQGSISRQTPGSLAGKYGANASMDKILCDEIRLSIKTAIMKAWRRRRKITTDIVLPLPCYREVAPYEKRGLIEIDPKTCNPSNECSLAPHLRVKLDELTKLRDVIKDSERPEDQRRSRTLREIYRKPKLPIEEKDCLNLGDAVFVLFAPNDSIIMTTNIADYKPLAEAIGKVAKTPQDLLSQP
jgi:hypothetical protein